MGLRRKYLRYMNNFIKSEFGGHKEIRMLELGNQEVRRNQGIKERTGKEYFTNLGMVHTSIDMNGKNGALKFDLSKEIITQEWTNHFDVITNSGTTEHVEPFEGQYECFKNIHNLCGVGGIMIHLVPDNAETERRGGFKNRHCNNYYTDDFFKEMALANGYFIMDSRLIYSLRCVCLKKTMNVKFMEDRDLFLSKIVRREDGRTYSYDGGNFQFK